MVKVTTQGEKTKEVDYKEGMSVGDALKAAGIKMSEKATISVNGKDADPETILKDGEHVVVTPKVSNG